MNVEKWMKKHPHTIKPLDTIEHARQIMQEHRINQLPVVRGGELVGIISDRDIRDAYPSVFADPMRKAAPNPHDVKVESVMTTNVITMAPDDGIVAAASLMRRERIGALPIVKGKQLVGILARSDLLEALIALGSLAEAKTAR
ncbi:MAG: CBS domain-containing protein [Deltaproteobacteria bacterium]|nr:CBS domain-containing protein [Deltaproteobacteria bacterium]